MEVVGVHVARAVAPNGATVIRVVFDGKDGASVIVNLASTVHTEDDPKAIERAKHVLIETARYKTALNDYDAQSNGNFDEISTAAISDDDDDQIYIYEYRDGEGSTQTPPSRMPSLKAAREEALRSAVDLLGDLKESGEVASGWLVRVRGEGGEFLFGIDADEAEAARRSGK